MNINHCATIPVEMALDRLDRVSAKLFPQYSRSRLQNWIKSGELTVDGELRRPKDRVSGGEDIEIDAAPDDLGLSGEDIPIDVVYEDNDILVVDKPAGLVVHPGAGNWSGTLLNALLYRDSGLSAVPRAGIVHRLDKDTSGLLVIARNIESQNSLVQQLQSREVSRIYQAVVYGSIDRSGEINAPIGRNPTNRVKMAIQSGGKEAITRYRVLERFSAFTHLEVALKTGRTHQIRVHLESIGHPIVGDSVYVRRAKTSLAVENEVIEQFRSRGRQALHAARLELLHPRTGQLKRFDSPLATDIAALLEALPAAR